ncbi:D-amino acid dehydrogenase [Polaromonas sp. OV174]|uniref:D-amino acid dehydrogenase n=1 Tax=Polaromonas sp. OV174 TaxID=1855300 RepID=UPI000B850AE8|nr:D-amino acid dehydrogenase [Polaromonas sp. OV174]
MKVAVIGAGIIGITTAYELAADGHEVTVFERRSAAAEEGSFANAGVVAPGYITPWAAPGMPGKVLGQLFSRHVPVTLSLPLSGRELAWLWQWRRACQLETHLANRARMQRLAHYSRNRLQQLSTELELDYECSPGYMVLLRSEKDSRQITPSLQVLSDAGVSFRQISAEEARQIEPALSPDTALHGAVHLPDDGVANCRQFALLLKNEAQRLGVSFEFNKAVAQMDRAQPASFLIAGEASPRHFDQVVLCAGQASAELLRPLGLKLPLVAVYGYSLTAQIRDPLNAPCSALMDERYKVSISRLGHRVRVAGGAEIGGSLESRSASAIQTLYKVLQDWFPGAAQRSSRQGNAQLWKGARPMLPDGPPLIGSSGRTGLWLNLGHGASGWALSCGSARALADLMAGRPTDIDMEGLGLGRLA